METTGNEEDYFYLNSLTGEILLIQSVKNIAETQFTLPVRVFDRPILTNEDRSSVIITIAKDRFPPQFINTPYIINGVSENLPVGSIIYNRVDAVDNDRKGNLVYEATGIYPANDFFAINPTNGNINITRQLKLDSLVLLQYSLQIIVYDSQVPDVRDTETVTINVLRNANGPQFSENPYTRTILETQELAVPILDINATDLDGDNIRYQLTEDINGGDGLNYFYLVPNTGVITLRQPVNGLGGRTYSLNVRATDSGRPSRDVDVIVNINIQAIENPTFSTSNYQTSVREDRQITYSFFRVSAVKSNPTGTIQYRAVGDGTAPFFFSVDQSTGDITIRNDLRNGAQNPYTLRIEAYDSAFPDFVAESTVTINVIRNPNSPVFIGGPYVTSIQDNSGLGTRIININATDLDINDKLTYSITGDSRCQTAFYINPDTGVVFLSRNLRVLSLAQFTCTLQVSDNGRPTPNTDTTTLTVNVGQIQFPQFSTSVYNGRVSENDGIGTSVVDVFATKNPPGTIVYEVVGEFPAPYFFGVNNSTGRVSIIEDLRQDSLREYKLLIAAYDELYPDLRSTSTVSITVDRNALGPVFNPSTITLNLPETTGIDTWARNINVTDGDSPITTCAITGNSKAQEFFQVNPRTCLLTLKKSLQEDLDQTTQYQITITASDNGNPGRSGSMIVYVNVPRDTVDPTIINLPSTVTIQESAQPTDLVYTIDASDGDLDGTVRCRMIGDFPASTFFSLDAATGRVTVNNSPKLHSLNRDSYTVRVECFDDFWPDNTVEEVLTVNVDRNPGFPLFLDTPYSITIPDTFGLGQTVLQARASDADGDSVTFKNLGDSSVTNFFIVLPVTGSIVLLRNLRTTDQTLFTFQIEATDGRGKTSQADVRITVTKNSGPPVFFNTPYGTTIPVSRPVGDRVISLSVTDPDPQGQIVCELEGGQTSQSYFQINNITHAISVRRDLKTNTDPNPRYMLLVKCYDSLVPNEQSYAVVNILVNRNEFPPRFAPSTYSARINDYDSPGTFVVTVTATDDDDLYPENAVTYSLDDQSRADNDFFTINPSTGIITVDKRVSTDTSPADPYVLYVIAKDLSAQPLSATATVTINVQRNVAPTFVDESTYNRLVDEASPVLNFTILTVSATDANDPLTLNGQIRYSIRDSAANRVFQINPNTGAISPRVDLESVSRNNWVFEVQATDGGLPALSDIATVSLTISKVGLPQFQPAEVEITIQENRPVNDNIYTIAAQDPIQGSVLLYELRGDGLGPDFFDINRLTGAITVKRPLIEDTQKITTYTLRVVGFRQSNPTEIAEAFVRVTVIRNPTSPSFPTRNYVFEIPEDQALGVKFGEVNAEDNDEGDNGVIDYSISTIGVIPSYSYDYFFINPSTGDLSVVTKLSEDPNTRNYTFSVLATDRGSPRRTSSASVLVKVTRNPSAPRFNPDYYNRTIVETTPVGNSLVTVFANDLDGDTISYEILQEPPDSVYFNINPSSGLITLSRSTEQDLQERYIIRVVATDGRSPPRFDTATVQIDVIRNPNSPSFNTHAPVVNVSEYATVNSVITTIRATDADSDLTLGGQLRYSIASVDPIAGNDYFIISPTSGDVILARTLPNNESPDSVTLTLSVTDRAAVPKSDTTTLQINVIRNLYAPVFTETAIFTDASERDGIGKSIAQVTATDADTGVPENQNTPNAEIEYLVIGTSDDTSSFDVTEDGTIIIKRPLYASDVTGTYTRFFQVQATDKSWNRKFSNINVTVTVTPLQDVLGDLGFIQPTYYKDIRENEIEPLVLFLDVVNQEKDMSVTCTFLSGNDVDPGVFTLTTDRDEKNCELRLIENGNGLDRERKSQYRFNIRVDPVNNRDKRAIGDDNAAIQTYNAWREAEVILYIIDVNDNAPVFVYPVYPRDGYITEKYYGAISIQATPDEPVLQVNATDIDEGPNGMVVYRIDPTETSNPPFELHPVEGEIFTTEEFEQRVDSPRQFRFKIQARDNPVNEAPLATSTEVVINLIESYNRFVLVLENKRANEILPQTEEIRQLIQLELGYLTIIERVEGKRTLMEQNNIITEMESTDIVFVLVGNEAVYGYRLLNNTNEDIANRILSENTQSNLKIRIQQETDLDVERVRLPYPQSSLIRTMVTKSYIWWMDDPWAALIALAAIIILLSIVGIIVIVFSYSRYMKFIQQYRLYQHNYGDPTEFVEPPSFLREYETQSLNMYVPPDEQVQSVGEINMTFEGDTMKDAMHTNHGDDVAAVINPIYQGEGQSQQQIAYNESTTIL